MSSELSKYIEKALEKKETAYNAEVINFPNEKKIKNSEKLDIQKFNFWRINDKSNVDQFRAVVGICFMFVALIVMGLYSNLI